MTPPSIHKFGTKQICKYSACAQHYVEKFLQPLLLLAIRWYVALAFFKSGLTKISNWDNTLALFHDEYQVPLLPPDLAAVMGTAGELLFPLLLVLGVWGRLSALGLFMVNAMAVISYPALFGFECPAALQTHVYWGALMLVVVAFGSGKWSFDGWRQCKSSAVL